MKTILMKDAWGKIRSKPAANRSAYEAAGWTAVQEVKPSKPTKTIVVDEPITLKISDVMSEPTTHTKE